MKARLVFADRSKSPKPVDVPGPPPPSTWREDEREFLLHNVAAFVTRTRMPSRKVVSWLEDVATYYEVK